MYEDLRLVFWWDGIKKDIAYFVACCDICNKVKAEHQKPTGLLQPCYLLSMCWFSLEEERVMQQSRVSIFLSF